MFKIGVIGCGKIAEKHLMGYRAFKNLHLTLFDTQVQMAAGLAKQFDCTWVENVEEILTDPEIRAVDICTPTPSHENLILQALKSGKHVFCEKPLTDTAESGRCLRQAALGADRLLMTGFLYRFHPAFELVKKVLEEKIIGQPYLAWFRLGGRGSHRLWKHQKDQGGGAVNEMLVHMLDLALWYFGKLEVVSSSLATVLPQRQVEGRLAQVDAEDFALIKVKSLQGVQVFVQSDLATPSYMNYMEVMGTEGSLFTSILDHLPTVVYCNRPRGIYQQGNNFYTFPKTNLFERELGYFLQCIQDGEAPRINSLEDSLELVQMVEKIKEAGVTK